VRGVVPVCSIIIREQELDPTKKYIFGFHPHGIIVQSRVAIFGKNFDDVFPGITNRRKPRAVSLAAGGSHVCTALSSRSLRDVLRSAGS
jgi:hypothetical protein